MSVTIPNIREQNVFKGDLFQAEYLQEDLAGGTTRTFVFKAPADKIVVFYGINFITQDGRAKLEIKSQVNVDNDGTPVDIIPLNGYIIKSFDSQFFIDPTLSVTQPPTSRIVLTELSGSDRRSGTSFDTQGEIAVLTPGQNYSAVVTNYETTDIKYKLRFVFAELSYPEKAIYLGRNF